MKKVIPILAIGVVAASAFTTLNSHITQQCQRQQRRIYRWTTVASAEMSTRRESFGEILSSAVIATTTTFGSPTVVGAIDEYPFKTCVGKVARAFPNAVTNAELVARVTRALDRFSYDESTLVAFSLCSDEVNRPLEDIFDGCYGGHFNMGGLAGFPFAGVTGFDAMASHIPDGGSCLIVYGPHVGVDSDGLVGKVDRRGKSKSGSCCGSAVAASKYVTAVYRGDVEKVRPSTEMTDAQQYYVSSSLLPYGERIAKASEPMVELPYATFELIDAMMEQIVKKSGPKVVGYGKIAMLGGIQINTPKGMSDYFLPLRFDIREKDGFVIEDLMWLRHAGSESRRKMTQ